MKNKDKRFEEKLTDLEIDKNLISKVNYRKLNTDDKLLNYGCFLCRVREMSWAGIVDHWSSRLHCANLSTQNSTIKCIDELDFEEAHEMVATNISQLQYELDRCFKTLVGIEYCLDIRNELNQTLFYQCLLCDNSIIDTLSLIEHLTTTEHRMNFLRTHFPTLLLNIKVFNKNTSDAELKQMSESVCAYIESIYGRLTPFACSRVEFDERALAIERTIDHFDERDNGTKYLRVLSLLQRTSPLKNQTSKIRCTGSLQNKNKKSTSESFSSIDLENCITSDDTDSSNSPRSESNERNYYDNSYGSKRKSQRSKDISPIRKYVRTDSHKQSEQDSKISNIRSKEEQSNEYSLLNELYESSELNEDQRIALIYSKYKKYKKNHKLHPSYYSEWKKFWYKRRSELMQSGINPRTYNFIPEWTTFWPLQMNHFYCDEILKTKIKQRTISIDLTNESLEINKGSSEKTSNELNNSVKLSNDNNMTEPITIDISSDEESPPPISNVKKATPSCTVEQFFSEVAKTGNILGSNNMKNFFEQFSELETEEQKNVIDYCKTLEESE